MRYAAVNRAIQNPPPNSLEVTLPHGLGDGVLIQEEMVARIIVWLCVRSSPFELAYFPNAPSILSSTPFTNFKDPAYPPKIRTRKHKSWPRKRIQ